MSLYNFAYFQVSAKAILRRGDDILLLMFHNDRYDFPGGRMDESEVDLSLHEVLSRELAEELGDNLKFKIKEIAFVSKRHDTRDGRDHRILTTFFEVDYTSGEVELSDEHSSSKWVKPKSLLANPEKFVSSDEYNQYKHYCESRL